MSLKFSISIVVSAAALLTSQPHANALEVSICRAKCQGFTYSPFLAVAGTTTKTEVYSNNQQAPFKQEILISLSEAGLSADPQGSGFNVSNQGNTSTFAKSDGSLSGEISCVAPHSVSYVFMKRTRAFDTTTRYWDSWNSYPHLYQALEKSGEVCVLGDLMAAADALNSTSDFFPRGHVRVTNGSLMWTEQRFECVNEIDLHDDGKTECLDYKPLPPVSYLIRPCK